MQIEIDQSQIETATSSAVTNAVKDALYRMNCVYFDKTFPVPRCRSPTINSRFCDLITNAINVYPICPFEDKEFISAQIYCINYQEPMVPLPPSNKGEKHD